MKSTSTYTPDDLPEPRLVSMFAYDGAEILDITGPMDVFALANLIHMNSGGRKPLYRIKVAAETKDVVVVTSAGIRLLADDSWSAGFLNYYKGNARKHERIGIMIDRLGLDIVKQGILSKND